VVAATRRATGTRKSRIFVFLCAPIIAQCNKIRASAPIRTHLCREKREQRDRGLIGKRERERGLSAKEGRTREGERVGKCAATRTHQGGGETAERNRTYFGSAVTYYQRRNTLLPTKRRIKTEKEREGKISFFKKKL